MLVGWNAAHGADTNVTRGGCPMQNMPFRVYMGYDSHEDITFEVRRLPAPPTRIKKAS
jgi:hypothetical protein